MARREAAQWISPRVAAGHFYPADAPELERTVRAYLEQASVPPRLRVRALIAPHAGYVCSGSVAAHSFKTLLDVAGTVRTVYLLGPAHWLSVHGVGLSGADSFLTPLGLAPIAAAQVRQLLQLGGRYRIADASHEVEHALAVELPFLQVALARFRVVPMLLDAEADPEQVARDLSLMVGDATNLIVVSSDLSHGYAFDEAVRLDRALLAADVAGDVAAVSRGQACGLLPILCLMHLARHFGWTPHLLDYRNSGDTCGPQSKVIGYGALAYSDDAPPG